jgi:hypothetical protein
MLVVVYLNTYRDWWVVGGDVAVATAADGGGGDWR